MNIYLNLHHDHNHCSCNCCGSIENECKDNHKQELDYDNLTEIEKVFLNKLIKVEFLPLAQFVVKSSKEHDFVSIALPCVYIQEKNETIESIKKTAVMLQTLVEKGFITLDFDIELENYDYNEYFSSDIFEYFKSTVKEGSEKQNFLGDIADIYKGSIALADGVSL